MSTEVAVVKQPEDFQLVISEKRFEIMAQNKVQMLNFIQKQLQRDVDFGVIPGTGTKPTLLQPGAQKICSLMNVYPDTEVVIRDLEGEHREYTAKTTLKHMGTDFVVATGSGSCSTKESKYRYRKSRRACPSCGREGLVKTRKGQWWCPKDEGCSETFRLDDPAVVDQQVGRVENPDIADQYNTCMKMASKRSLIAATLNLSGGWSEHFTQDLEDMKQVMADVEASKPKQPPSRFELMEKYVKRAVDLSLTGEEAKSLFEDACKANHKDNQYDVLAMTEDSWQKALRDFATEVKSYAESKAEATKPAEVVDAGAGAGAAAADDVPWN